MPNPLVELGSLIERVGVRYAVIGAHAVNVWVEPRATADIDLTVEASVPAGRRLHDALLSAGYRLSVEHGGDAPSGPDFERYVSLDGAVTIELQAAKTTLQREVLDRARPTEDGVRIATPEDLIVLKLIAGRAKDEIDLLGLVRLPSLDWPYVERWAAEWQVTSRLENARHRAGSDPA